MRRALIMSDTHGEGDNLRYLLDDAWKQTGPGPIDHYVHCGDGVNDLVRMEPYILVRDPRASFHTVRGNCDFMSDEPDFAVFTMEGVRIFVCHGHRYRVKSGLITLGYAAEEQGCTLALYGHTHIPDMENGRVLMINPGCTQDRRMALLEIDEGKPHVRLLRL